MLPNIVKTRWFPTGETLELHSILWIFDDLAFCVLRGPGTRQEFNECSSAFSFGRPCSGFWLARFDPLGPWTPCRGPFAGFVAQYSST